MSNDAAFAKVFSEGNFEKHGPNKDFDVSNIITMSDVEHPSQDAKYVHHGVGRDGDYMEFVPFALKPDWTDGNDYIHYSLKINQKTGEAIARFEQDDIGCITIDQFINEQFSDERFKEVGYGKEFDVDLTLFPIDSNNDSKNKYCFYKPFIKDNKQYFIFRRRNTGNSSINVDTIINQYVVAYDLDTGKATGLFKYGLNEWKMAFDISSYKNSRTEFDKKIESIFDWSLGFDNLSNEFTIPADTLSMDDMKYYWKNNYFTDYCRGYIPMPDYAIHKYRAISKSLYLPIEFYIELNGETNIKCHIKIDDDEVDKIYDKWHKLNLI